MKKSKVEIQYPTYKFIQKPTPADKLMICDGCGLAVWVPHAVTVYSCTNCRGHKGGFVRMRNATREETKKGIESIQVLI